MAESEELEGAGRSSKLFLESGSQSALEATQLKWNHVSTTTGEKTKTKKPTNQPANQTNKNTHIHKKTPQNQTSLADMSQTPAELLRKDSRMVWPLKAENIHISSAVWISRALEMQTLQLSPCCDPWSCSSVLGAPSRGCWAEAAAWYQAWLPGAI